MSWWYGFSIKHITVLSCSNVLLENNRCVIFDICILKKQGFLDGEPGNYLPSEIGKQYALQKDFHRGTGGYAQYNRYWTTNTLDDSITDVLHITPALIAEARRMVSEAARQEMITAQNTLQKAISNRPDSEESSNGVNGRTAAGVTIAVLAGIYMGFTKQRLT